MHQKDFYYYGRALVKCIAVSKNPNHNPSINSEVISMINSNFLDELAKNLAGLIPQSLRDVQRDMEKNFRAVLQSSFTKLDLVTREEFEVQMKVLARTREKLEELEKQVTLLETRLGEQTTTPPLT